MRIAVAGSIATDILMTFPGRFKDQFLEEQMHKVSLSFLVDELVVHRGGVGANICYGMAQLGQPSLLVGSVGADFAEYGAALTEAGVDVSHVRVCRLIDIELEEEGPKHARMQLERMCSELLANPLIESVQFRIEGA